MILDSSLGLWATKKNSKLVTNEQIKSTNTDKVLDCEVRKVESDLKAVEITIGKNFSKGKKANKLFQSMKDINSEKKSDIAITGQDANLMML